MVEKGIDVGMEAKKKKKEGVLRLGKKKFVLPLQNLTQRRSPRGNQVQHSSWEH